MTLWLCLDVDVSGLEDYLVCMSHGAVNTPTAARSICQFGPLILQELQIKCALGICLWVHRCSGIQMYLCTVGVQHSVWIGLYFSHMLSFSPSLGLLMSQTVSPEFSSMSWLSGGEPFGVGQPVNSSISLHLSLVLKKIETLLSILRHTAEPDFSPWCLTQMRGTPGGELPRDFCGLVRSITERVMQVGPGLRVVRIGAKIYKSMAASALQV